MRVFPSWLGWAENLSFITFSYDALMTLEFTDDRVFRSVHTHTHTHTHTHARTRTHTHTYDSMGNFFLPPSLTHTHTHSCNTEASSYPSCNTTLTGLYGNGTISGPDVLREFGGVYPLWGSFLALLGFSLLYRLLAYLSLRFLNRP